MNVTLWGTRGSLASPGPETLRYGGNTSCVEVRAGDGSVLVLDGGTGIRRLGTALLGEQGRVDVLLTHLHMDHIQGLGFFAPFFEAGREVHVWGPATSGDHMRDRLARYLSPPLFPVRLRDLPCDLTMHGLSAEPATIGPFAVMARLVCHPGATVGYRVIADGHTLAYLPDHEPALGAPRFPQEPQWTSGYDVASRADLLVHDAQYADAEYAAHVGWGHSSYSQAIALATLAGVGRLMTFHHDPSHTDATLDAMHREACAGLPFPLIPGREGDSIEV